MNPARAPAVAALIMAALWAPGLAVAQRAALPPPTAKSEQTTPLMLERPVEPAGLVDPDAYIVGPGDVFGLNLSGRVTSSMDLRVGPEGSMYIPGWSSVRLAGLSLTQAREKVIRLLERDLRGVDIEFQLLRVRLIKVQLTGEVKSSAPLHLPATSRVSDAVAEENQEPRASRRWIEVRRRDGSRLAADLELFRRTGRQELNPYLLDGDIVHVPSALEFTEVYGAVARAGRYERGPADSLSTLLGLAGGYLPAARLDRALLVRWTTPTRAESVWFRVDSVFSGVTNPPLRNGDRVYVYFIAGFHMLDQVEIGGEVERPGIYPIRAGHTRLSDLIRSAGGFRPRAELTAIRLYRPARDRGVETSDRPETEADQEIARLSSLSRDEMTTGEYEVLRTRMAARRANFRIDWTRLQRHQELDLFLTGGDIIVVDPMLASVRVEGEVKRPGLVDFRAGMHADQYVQLAGGFSKRAARGRVLVTRAVTGQTLRARDVPVLSPGDMIWVPEKSDKSTWEQLQTFVGVAAQVATLVLVLRR